MKKYTAVLIVGVVTMVLLVGVVAAAFPASTNDYNRSVGWAHVNEVGVDIGEVTLEFISTRSFLSCFEYRTDGDTSQAISDTHYNPDLVGVDDLYPNFCIINETEVRSFNASDYVEIRLTFGAEGDERFNWTPFDVIPDVQTKEDCKDGGWEAYGFNNQGLCIQYINTGKDSR